MSVYFIQDLCCGLIKIGYTDGPVRARVSSIQTSSPHELKLIGDIDGSSDVEMELHELLKEHRARGEWFHPAPIVVETIENRLLQSLSNRSDDASEQADKDFDAITDRARVAKAAGTDSGRFIRDAQFASSRSTAYRLIADAGDDIAAETWSSLAAKAAKLFALASEQVERDLPRDRCSFCLERRDTVAGDRRARICRACVRLASTALGEPERANEEDDVLSWLKGA